VGLGDKYPGIPWKEIAGMRNIVVHEYFGVDLELMWEVAKKGIPELKDRILRVKEDLDKNSQDFPS